MCSQHLFAKRALCLALNCPKFKPEELPFTTAKITKYIFEPKVPFGGTAKNFQRTVLSLTFLEDFPGVLASSSALINSCSISGISSCTEIGDSTMCGSGCSPDGDHVLLGEDILLVDILFVLPRLSHVNSAYVYTLLASNSPDWRESLQVFFWRVARRVRGLTRTRQIKNSRRKLARVGEFFPREPCLWQQ